MNVLDWCLVALVGIYALSGYWQGFVTGAFATAGLLLGGLFGVWLAPIALGDADPSLWVSLGALFIVILAASLGQALFQYVGARIRARIRWQPIRAVDAVGGAALSAVAVLIVAWALGVAVSGSRIGAITPTVRDSTVLAKVDSMLPGQATGVLQAFNNVVGTTFFPRYLEPFAPERIVEVKAGPQRLLTDPDVVDAQSSVLKVRGTNACGSGLEGTGFLYSDGRLMTNAHVVAGVRQPEVELGDGTSVTATVVHYDPDIDVAVLALDDGDLPTWSSTARPARRTAWPSWATPRTARTTSRPDGSAPCSGCARPTSTATAPSSARCSRCAGSSGPATPAARSCPRAATSWAWSSPRRSPTATRATR